MQWLIDIIQAWVTANFLQTGYVYRGSHGFNPDFTLINFTDDGLWHDLDLSAIVPAGAKCVNVKFRVEATVATNSFRWRPKGETDTFFTCFLRPPIANLDYGELSAMDIDSNRIGQYNMSAGNWNAFGFTIMGWWL